MRRFAWIYVVFVLVSCERTTKVSQQKPVPVQVSQASVADVPIYLEAIGTVYARVTVHLKPQVQGEIASTHVRQGQNVQQGQLLYTLDDRMYQARVHQAQATVEKGRAQLTFAKQKLERYSQLKEKDFVSPLTLEELRSNVASAEAQLAEGEALLIVAQIDLEHCQVSSPIEGKLSQFAMDVGNLVKAYDDQALTEILQLRPIEVRFSFPQKDFLQIQKYYQQGELNFLVQDPMNTDRHIEGHVSFLDNKIDLATGTILLKGVLPNEDEHLWPGAFVRVKVLLYVNKGAIVVPEAAVRIGQKGYYAFVVNKEQHAELRKVTVGPVVDGKRVVISGVDSGEYVVTLGQLNLKPDSPVLVQ